MKRDSEPAAVAVITKVKTAVTQRRLVFSQRDNSAIKMQNAVGVGFLPVNGERQVPRIHRQPRRRG